MTQNTLHKQTARFISAVSANLPELDSDVMQGWIQNPKAMQKALTEALCQPPTTLTAIIDYGLSLALMIQLGKYDWINSDIDDKRFSITGEGKWEVEYEIIHLDPSISSQDAVAEIKKRGLEPAKIEELLAFGAKYSELQRKFPIVALGSVAEIEGNRSVACLGNDAERILNVSDWVGGWNAHCRFLTVKSRRRLDKRSGPDLLDSHIRHVGP